jgi:heme oxygenase
MRPSLLLERLRASTRPLHTRVEARVDLTGRCSTRRGYEQLLVQMLGLYAPLEAQLARLDWAGTSFDFEQRRKEALLRADLAALGVTRDAPACDTTPELGSLASGFGCLYVLEGSTLGGQIILRHVERSLDLSAKRGASFFDSYGPSVGPMWRAFGDAASAHCDTETRIVEASAAATRTFEAFDRWLGSPASSAQPTEVRS